MKAFALNSGKAVAIVFKVGTSTMARAIIEQEQPELLEILTAGTRWGTGASFEQGYNHRFVKKTDADGKELLFPVRDPVERFRSACAQIWKGENTLKDKSLDELVDEAGNGSTNPHLRPQLYFLDEYKNAVSIRLYRFPTDIDQMALDAGLSLPLPVVNESATKPDLTPEQLAQVQAIYSDDIALYNSITEAGQVYVPPPKPATADDKAVALQTLKANRELALAGGFTFEGKRYQTRDVRDIINILTVGIQAGRKPSFTTQFRTADNTWTAMNAAKAQEFLDAMVAAGQAVWEQFAIKEATVLAAATLDELAAMDLSI